MVSFSAMSHLCEFMLLVDRVLGQSLLPTVPGWWGLLYLKMGCKAGESQLFNCVLLLIQRRGRGNKISFVTLGLGVCLCCSSTMHTHGTRHADMVGCLVNFQLLARTTEKSEVFMERATKKRNHFAAAAGLHVGLSWYRSKRPT